MRKTAPEKLSARLTRRGAVAYLDYLELRSVAVALSINASTSTCGEAQ